MAVEHGIAEWNLTNVFSIFLDVLLSRLERRTLFYNFTAPLSDMEQQTSKKNFIDKE